MWVLLPGDVVCCDALLCQGVSTSSVLQWLLDTDYLILLMRISSPQEQYHVMNLLIQNSVWWLVWAKIIMAGIIARMKITHFPNPTDDISIPLQAVNT